MQLFVLEVVPNKKMYDQAQQGRVRLVMAKSWSQIIDEGLRWAKKDTLRVAEITPELAKRLYKGIKIEK